MNINDIVLNIRPKYFCETDRYVWLADNPAGRVVLVEPENYEFWFVDADDTVYTRRDAEGLLGYRVVSE